MNTRAFGVGLIVVSIIGFVIGWAVFDGNAVAQPPAPVAARTVSDIQYDIAYPFGHTFLCLSTDKESSVARDWHLTDRWVKNQLTYDTYMVDGRVYSALHIITDDKALPRGHVRFRKVRVNIGTGPTLEGHSYLKTLINGNPASLEQELLFVEFNGRLESQRRPLPACGTPRS